MGKREWYLDSRGHKGHMKEPEGWGSVVEVRLEGLADGRAVECERKKAVTMKEQSLAQKEETPLFL